MTEGQPLITAIDVSVAAERKTEPRLNAQHLSRLSHQSVIKGAGVGVQHACGQAQFSPRSAPTSHGGEHLAEDSLRFGGLESETLGGGKRDGDSRVLPVLR